MNTDVNYSTNENHIVYLKYNNLRSCYNLQYIYVMRNKHVCINEILQIIAVPACHSNQRLNI